MNGVQLKIEENSIEVLSAAPGEVEKAGAVHGLSRAFGECNKGRLPGI